MIDITKNIAARLKIARSASGFKTSKEFAERHNIALSTYCQHETGKRPLSIEQLYTYAALTYVEPIWLLTGEGNPCSTLENKQMEQKILQAQEKLGGSGALPAVPIPLIADQDRFSYVNMQLFRIIILEIAPLLKQITDDQVTEAMDFCFDLYNRIITLDARDEERIKVIKIGLKSFFDGLGVRGKETKSNKHNRLVS